MLKEDGSKKTGQEGTNELRTTPSGEEIPSRQVRLNLSTPQKRFIVEQNACDEKPSDVARAFEEEFKIKITAQLVQKYDPTKAAGSKLSEKLTEHYWQVREKYEQQEQSRGIGSIDYRLRRLAVIERISFTKGNHDMVLRCLQQAAEDKGGKYTNKREMSGPNGGPIPLSVESRMKAAIAEALRKLMQRGKKYAEARADLVTLGVDEADIPDERELANLRPS